MKYDFFLWKGLQINLRTQKRQDAFCTNAYMPLLLQWYPYKPQKN